MAADSVTGRITTLATFPGGSLPSGVAVAPWGNRIYVALNGRNLVAAIDTATRRVVRIAPTGVAPFGVALTPDGTRLFVSNWGGRRPFFYERRAYSAGTPVLVDKRGIAASGTVSVLDAVNLRRIAEIPVGLHPFSLHVSPDGRVLAIANSNSDSVTLIDAVTLDDLLDRASRQNGTTRRASISGDGLHSSRCGSRGPIESHPMASRQRLVNAISADHA